ncbi:hypothetical protein GY45DRAFT_663289 [Cubamyces sp. BRFM 1775]|nr:hypothetical protein GY45DRAFT_663289 [Cubamyces sp. BRFM 1775]
MAWYNAYPRTVACGPRNTVPSIAITSILWCLVTQVSTVAQFRHLDYGMEECRLTITIPTSDTGFDPAVILRKPANVDIWFLNNSQELNPAMHGSWAPVASRIGFYTTLSLPSSDSVEHMTPAFACPSGGFTTVELACATTSPDCYLDFWQRPSSTGKL